MSDDVELSASRSCLFVRAEWGEIEHFSMNLLMTKRSERGRSYEYSFLMHSIRDFYQLFPCEKLFSLFVLYDPNGHL